MLYFEKNIAKNLSETYEPKQQHAENAITFYQYPYSIAINISDKFRYPGVFMNWNLKQKNNFEEFLAHSGLIRKDKIKYYIYWVNKFHYYCKYRFHKPINHNIVSYLEKLEKDVRIADWQVKQAADAVLIYTEKFLSQQKISILSTISAQMDEQGNCKTNRQQNNNWGTVLSKFHNNIRFRH